MEYKYIGNSIIREARKRRHLTLREFADQVGTSAAHISSIEKDKTIPSMDTVVRYVNHLGLDLHYRLIENDDEDLKLAILAQRRNLDEKIAWNNHMLELKNA